MNDVDGRSDRPGWFTVIFSSLEGTEVVRLGGARILNIDLASSHKVISAQVPMEAEKAIWLIDWLCACIRVFAVEDGSPPPSFLVRFVSWGRRRRGGGPCPRQGNPSGPQCLPPVAAEGVSRRPVRPLPRPSGHPDTGRPPSCLSGPGVLAYSLWNAPRWAGDRGAVRDQIFTQICRGGKGRGSGEGGGRLCGPHFSAVPPPA